MISPLQRFIVAVMDLYSPPVVRHNRFHLVESLSRCGFPECTGDWDSQRCKSFLFIFLNSSGFFFLEAKRTSVYNFADYCKTLLDGGWWDVVLPASDSKKWNALTSDTSGALQDPVCMQLQHTRLDTYRLWLFSGVKHVSRMIFSC